MFNLNKSTDAPEQTWHLFESATRTSKTRFAAERDEIVSMKIGGHGWNACTVTITLKVGLI